MHFKSAAFIQDIHNNDHMIRIGYHISTSGARDLAFDRAASIGCNTMQIFLSNPRSWSVSKASIDEQAAFKTKEKNSNIKPVIAHMPYLPNVASSDNIKRTKSIECLKKTALLCDQLGIEYLVTHLGSHMGAGKSKGIKNAISTINELDCKVCILLENEAGQKNSIGSDLHDMAEILEALSIKNKGFCLDTCHAFAAGYDIREESTAAEIGKILDFDRIKVLHLNDALYDVGSHKDRHENFGMGFIGLDGFRQFFKEKKLLTKPMIMETPGRVDISMEDELNEVKLFLERAIYN